jgi:hypothetical protein
MVLAFDPIVTTTPYASLGHAALDAVTFAPWSGFCARPRSLDSPAHEDRTIRHRAEV